jgi:hypothetical protein
LPAPKLKNFRQLSHSGVYEGSAIFSDTMFILCGDAITITPRKIDDGIPTGVPIK